MPSGRLGARGSAPAEEPHHRRRGGGPRAPGAGAGGEQEPLRAPSGALRIGKLAIEERRQRILRYRRFRVLFFREVPAGPVGPAPLPTLGGDLSAFRRSPPCCRWTASTSPTHITCSRPCGEPLADAADNRRRWHRGPRPRRRRPSGAPRGRRRRPAWAARRPPRLRAPARSGACAGSPLSSRRPASQGTLALATGRPRSCDGAPSPLRRGAPLGWAGGGLPPIVSQIKHFNHKYTHDIQCIDTFSVPLRRNSGGLPGGIREHRSGDSLGGGARRDP